MICNKKSVIWFIDRFLTFIASIFIIIFIISLLTMILSIIEYLAGYIESIKINIIVTLLSFVFYILSIFGLSKIEDYKI